LDPISTFVGWLAQTPWSIALHESLYAYTWIETAHVIAITLFVGTIAMVDFRLLGFAWNTVPVSQMTARILPWTVAGFAIMIVTGVLLFYAIPVRSWHSVWFRAKLVLLLVGAVNIFVFHFRVRRDRAAWDTAQRTPLGARISALVSLTVWLSIIVLGRMIAYNWFDCDKPQSQLIYTAAGCSTYPKDEF
jgi:uncharacterized membrane protein